MNFKDVLGEELEELGRRRALRREAEAEASEDPPAAGAETPAVNPDALVGLCFSGGGIRSATFNLGLIRGLHRWGVLGFVDYLSTVSGGGYIGSYVANLYRQGRELDVLDSGDDKLRTEPPGVKHLRGLGRFLTPTGGLGEWLEAFAPLVRGILWNCAFFMLAGVALAGLFAFLLNVEGEWIFAFPHVTATLAALGLALLVLMGSVFSRKELPGHILLVMLAGVVLVGLMDALPWTLALVRREPEWLQGAAVASALGSLTGSGVLTKVPAKLYTLLARVLAFLLVIVLPLVLFLLALDWFVANAGTATSTTLQLGSIASLALFFFIDFNRSSLHGFYQDRIAATFLDDNPPKLSEFEGKPGPLHLVNVALNAPAEQDPSLRDRQADFFTLSCLHVGGPRTGYAQTEAFEAAQPEFTLANAVAISGAAAAPNMGSYTDALLRPLMTLLNVRMGYWAPNPSKLRDHSSWTPWLRYLFKEMRGAIRSDEKLVNLSDGGHLENLGAFELLRRKCKLIIVGDGEADLALSFGAMATLIRFAQVELGANIEIDLDDIRPNAEGMSTRHAALGTIHYADGSVGRLLYLKSSLTGHEAPDVLYYRDQNPDFPHESTADQWFDDAQFDAYRCLGEEVVDSLFQGLGWASPTELDLDDDRLAELLASLAVVLAPTSRSRSGDLTRQLDALQNALMHPDFAAYRLQLIPTIHSKPIADTDLHSLTPVVMMQLQLMENAVEHLGLLDIRSREALANRGWMNEFRRWSQSEAFSRMALVCLPSFGANLTEFAETALQLGTRYAWAEFPARAKTLALIESTPANASMVTGLAEYRDEEEAFAVHRLVMRNGFGGRDRIEAAIAALRERYQGQGLCFVETAAEVARGLPADAYMLRRRQSEWTRDDEDAVLNFTRDQVTSKDDPTKDEPSKDEPAKDERPPKPDGPDPFMGMMAFDIPRPSSSEDED